MKRSCACIFTAAAALAAGAAHAQFPPDVTAQMESVLIGKWARTTGTGELPSEAEALAALAGCSAPRVLVQERAEEEAEEEAATEDEPGNEAAENAASDAAAIAALPVPPPAGLERRALAFTPGLNIFRESRDWYFVTRSGVGDAADDRYLRVSLDWNPTPQGLRIRVAQTDAWMEFGDHWGWGSLESDERETYSGIWGEILLGRTIIAGTEYNLAVATEVDLTLVSMGRDMLQLLGFSPTTKRTYIECPR